MDFLSLCKNFNSSMVRLRAVCLLIRINPSLHFNSSMVRLRGLLLEELPTTPSYFNSSMVRLRADGRRSIGRRYLFQFQYGTIKSSGNSIRGKLRDYFNSSMVRLREALVRKTSGFIRISIPVWYD